MTGVRLADALEQRFSARPHVGVVTHFEGWDVSRTGAFARAVLEASGLHVEDAIEDVRGQPVFNAVAPVPSGDGMELWLIASEKASVGCKLEIRLFHVMEDAALADEYLAGLAGRLEQPRIG